MALTVEIDGDGARVVDTAAGRPVWGPSLVTSTSITEFVAHKIVYATGSSGVAVSFGGVSAAKVLVVKASGLITLTLTVNSVPLAIAMSGVFVLNNSSGQITAATVGQSTGSDVTVDILVAG